MARERDSKFYYPPNRGDENKIAFNTERVTDRANKVKTNYDNDIDVAERSRNNQYLIPLQSWRRKAF